jgi:di/tripeptidase
MAEKVMTLQIRWENQKSFEFKVKEPGATDFISIVSAEENSDIGILWPNIQKICEKYLCSKMNAIGDEMKEP